jgi:HAD superfamily hydrolase (TIGR01509 family)
MNFQAVLFDCDGVLVDSEPITNAVLRDMLEERGWVMSSEDCFRYFVGKAVKDHKAEIEARTGLPLTEEWLHAFRLRRNEALQARLQVMPGAQAAVADAYEKTQGAIACASGADRFKVEMQLTHVELMPYFEGRIFSGHEMARTKPAPDVYLAAAAQLECDPVHCLVIEDSTAGIEAGVAAGATVWALCTDPSLAPVLLEAGASRLFPHMGVLPELWRSAFSQLQER